MLLIDKIGHDTKTLLKRYELLTLAYCSKNLKTLSNCPNAFLGHENSPKFVPDFTDLQLQTKSYI